MNKRIKLLASALTIALVSSSLIGCGTKATPTSTDASKTKEKKEVVIWSQYTDKDLQIIKDFADTWSKQSGYPVKVVEDKGGFDSLVTASKSPNGPDVLVGLANDHLGSFVKGNLIDEVPSGVMDDSNYIDPALAASSYNGKRYSVPLTLETYLLFYNKDKVPTPPKTWDEMIEMGKKVGFNYCLNDFYYSLAVIRGAGGYVFKGDDKGSFDVNDIGLNNEDAVKGFTMINDLANTSKLVSPSVTGDIARGNFQNGKVGLYISGPWDVNTFTKAKVNFGVAPYPQINGKPVPTTSGIKIAVVSKTAKNKDGAWEFMKYLAANGPMAIFKQTAAIPVLKSDLAKDEIKNNPITAAFSEQAKYAVPMPSAPEFGQVWEPAKNNITLMITNKLTPKQAADNLVKQFKEKIDAMK